MKLLRTIALFPRPWFCEILPPVVLVLAFYAVQQPGVAPSVGPNEPLSVAVAAWLFAHLIRILVTVIDLPPTLPRRLLVLVGIPFGFALLNPVLHVPSAAAVQQAFLVFLLCQALLILGVLHFAPRAVSWLPYDWAGLERGAPEAMALVCLSILFRASVVWAIMHHGTPEMWVIFVSIGTILVQIFTDRSIVLHLARGGGRDA